LGLGKVPRDDGSETKDPAVLNYRALRALAGKKTLFLVTYLSGFLSSAQKESQGDGAQVVDIEAFGRLVRWFGPFRNKQGEETILDRMRLTCSLP